MATLMTFELYYSRGPSGERDFGGMAPAMSYLWMEVRDQQGKPYGKPIRVETRSQHRFITDIKRLAQGARLASE